MADEFAAKRKTKVSYNDEGYADFDKVIQEDIFKNGIERLKVGFCLQNIFQEVFPPNNLVFLNHLHALYVLHQSLL